METEKLDDTEKNENISEFLPQAEFNFKKGVFPILANIIGGAFMFLAIILLFYLFPMPKLGSEGFLPWISESLIGISVVLLFFVLNFLIKYIFFKIGDCGRVKLHIGLMIEIFSEKPLIKKSYILSEIVYLLFFGLIILMLCFFQSLMWYLPVSFIASNVLINVPVLIFLFRQPKNSYIMLTGGVLTSFKKNK